MSVVTAEPAAEPPVAAVEPREDLVRVFEHEPDLLSGLDPRTADLLRRRAAAPRVWLERGPWDPPSSARLERSFGLLVVDGLLTRSISLSGRDCPELIGAGDVIRPWEDDGPAASIAHATRWTALERTTLAVLDERFATVACRCPTVMAALLARCTERTRALGFHFAIAHVRHAETRLLMLLWHLADRWGRVTRDGVHLPLRLTHELLAQLACMRRPTASTSLQRLTAEGLLARREDGTWLLSGEPPAGADDPRLLAAA